MQPSIPEGAEDSVYMGQTLPYRTANRYITSISELLALPGFGREHDYLKLAPYITALPHGREAQCLHRLRGGAGRLPGPAGRTDFSSDTDEALAKNRANAGGCFPKLSDYAAAMQEDPTHWAGAGQAAGPGRSPASRPGRPAGTDRADQGGTGSRGG